MPDVRVKKGILDLWNVQYQVEKVLASIMSDTPLIKNIVQKNPSRLNTGTTKIITRKCMQMIFELTNVCRSSR